MNWCCRKKNNAVKCTGTIYSFRLKNQCWNYPFLNLIVIHTEYWTACSHAPIIVEGVNRIMAFVYLMDLENLIQQGKKDYTYITTSNSSFIITMLAHICVNHLCFSSGISPFEIILPLVLFSWN